MISKATVVGTALAALAAVAPALASDAGSLWLEVNDGKGKVVEGLSADSFTIAEGGAESAVLSVERVRPGGVRVALVFDRALTGPGPLRRGAEAVVSLAQPLLDLGEVELLFADPHPEEVLRANEPLILVERLRWLAMQENGRDAIRELRRATLGRLRVTAPRLTAAERAQVVMEAVDAEVELVRESLRQLLAWAGEARGEGPRLLIWVHGGFDLDPITAYSQWLEAETLRELARSIAEAPQLDGSLSEAARALAALGWTVLPLALGAVGQGAFQTVEEGEAGEEFYAAPTAVFRPGSGRRGRDPSSPPEATLLAAREPLERLAAATGGEVVQSAEAFRHAVERLGGRHLVRYASVLPVDSGVRPLEVRVAGDLQAIGRRWVARGYPPAVTAARLERLLRGEEVETEWDLTAAFEPAPGEGEPGRLEARLDLRRLESERQRLRVVDLRVTVGIIEPDGALRLSPELRTAEDLASTEEWLYGTAVEAAGAIPRLAVVVERLPDGPWAGSVAAVVGDAIEGLLPRPAVVELQAPRGDVLQGSVRFEADVFDPAVGALRFFLDDRLVAEVGRSPWRARVDLGPTPRRQTLAVVAYDRRGDELGRDAMVLNGGGGLAVEIVRPPQLRGVGPVEVEADLTVPRERRLERLLFYWNNELVATVHSPPYRRTLHVPPEQPTGYIRVVALLDDGSMAEDVAFMNGPAAAERIDVNLVELYVVVTDRQGRPVTDLTRGEFRIRERGKLQELATFAPAGELPVTLGLAIDSSASMFIKLPRVQQAASRFLRSLYTEGDRIFVVDFDSQPRLARSATADLSRALDSIARLQADGRTALWESIVYSLVQLQGARGRKALVVFSDGADEDDRFPFKSCLQVAERMGVPIYLILMRREPAREGWSLFSRSFSSRVDRLIGATGGRVFYAKEYRSLDDVYAEIELELRSQYLLAYYSGQEDGADPWRDVDVEVARAGLKPRTLPGYWR